MIPIQLVFLQAMSPIESFWNWLFPQTQAGSGPFELLPSYSPVITFAIIVFCVFYGLRILKNLRKFPIPETRVDTYDFFVQDWFPFSANISRDEEPLAESTLQELEAIPEIKEGIAFMREWASKEQLFVYQGVYTDIDKAVHLSGEGSRFTMITTVDLTNDDYYTLSRKGKFDWGTARKEHHRQVIGLEPSAKYDGVTIDGNDKDVWFMYPVFNPKLGKQNIFQSAIKQLITNRIEIHQLIIDPKQAAKIASIFDWLVPLKNQQHILGEIDRTDKLSQKMVKKAYHLAAEERVNGDIARGIAVRQEVYKVDMKPKTPFGTDPIIWLVFTMIGAFIGVKIGSSVSELQNTDPSMLALLGGGVVLAIYLLVSSRKKDREKEDVEKIDQSKSLEKR